MNFYKDMQFTEIGADVTALSSEEIAEHLERFENWERIDFNGDAITRSFEMQTIDQAGQFVRKFNEKAESMSQNPLVRVVDTQVEVVLNSEQLGGLHLNNFIMASHVDELYDRWETFSGERDEVTEASDQSFPASDPPGY